MESFLKRIEDGEPRIYVHDKVTVRDKLVRLHAKGIQHLHIISDFDMTLTKYWVNGKRSLSSHGVLENSASMTVESKEALAALYRKYYPIEVSHSATHADKVAAMVEWWQTAHDHILSLGLTKADIVEMVKTTRVTFREGLAEFIGLCKAKSVPLLVFSAGLADVIQEILSQDNLLSSNMSIVSNRMKWQDGKCIGFYDPLIHVFNKNEAVLSDSPHADLMKNRANVILMGDSLGDIRMGDGVEADVKLSIGYLNHDKETLLEQYAQVFDIVILDDSPMDFPILLLSCLSEQ